MSVPRRLAAHRVRRKTLNYLDHLGCPLGVAGLVSLSVLEALSVEYARLFPFIEKSSVI